MSLIAILSKKITLINKHTHSQDLIDKTLLTLQNTDPEMEDEDPSELIRGEGQCCWSPFYCYLFIVSSVVVVVSIRSDSLVF